MQFISGLILIVVLECSCKDDYSGRFFYEFSEIIKDFSLEDKFLILKDSDGCYRVYAASKNKIQQLLDGKLDKYGYSGWKKLSTLEIIGTQPSYMVDGIRNNVKINLKKGATYMTKLQFL